MLNVVMVDSGNYLGRGREYVEVLKDSISRNLPEGFPGQFQVFSDYCDDYGPEILTRKLPGDLNGWYNKLYLFKSGLFPINDRIVYFDLDTVITGKLDDLFAYDGEFAILRDFYRPHGYQSSVMAWTPCIETDQIWSEWKSEGCPQVEGGDQAWIERRVNNPDLLQKLYPGLFASYKADGCAGSPPKGASVIVFHGRPRPHEVIGNWVPHVWKIGGGTMASLETVCNTGERTLLQNVRENCELSLPWLDIKPAHDRPCAIIGGGPSLVETIDGIPDMAMFGLNAAAIWLLNRRDAEERPYRVSQIILDARPEMAEMVDDRAQFHFFASQCDPSVFKVPGTSPTIFHPNIPGMQSALADRGPVHLIGGGSSVGLQALVIAYVLGYRTIHLVGMDSSYRDGEGHAYPQALNDGERLIAVNIDGSMFECAPWMAQQAEEFQIVAAELANMGCEIIVHGDGLLPAVAHSLANDHALAEQGIIAPDGSPACQRASAVVRRLAEVENPVGAEIGVFRGGMSRRLLAYRPDMTLYMVDSWTTTAPDAAYAKSGDFHAGLGQADQDRFAAEAAGVVGFAGLRAIVVRASSEEAAEAIPDGSLDFVFIDADHSYDGCVSDIRRWMRKIKPGGLLSGHDFGNSDFPGFGVDRAVREFALKYGLSIELGQNFTWHIRLPEAIAISSAA